MSSHSYHSASRGSRTSRTSHQPPTHLCEYSILTLDIFANIFDRPRLLSPVRHMPHLWLIPVDGTYGHLSRCASCYFCAWARAGYLLYSPRRLASSSRTYEWYVCRSRCLLITDFRLSERILPQIPIQFLFTLFLLEHQLTGDWRLIIPYAACSIVFYL
jgi:hypothetical protein